MKKIIIVTGGTLGDWVLSSIASHDMLIGCDRGALFLVRHGFTPDLAIGDFDSVSDDERQFIKLNCKQYIDYDPIDKDLTDTAIAIEKALAYSTSGDEIIILGAIGTRIDHTLANIHLLRVAVDQGVNCKIVDTNNEIILIKKPTKLVKGNYSHVSILPITNTVTGVSLHGFAYPLYRATLTIGQTLGVSNIMVAQEVLIEMDEGYLLVIQSKD
jgi:thiamine pyrophosphokinase